MKKGTTNNPRGGKPDKVFRDALVVALKRYKEGEIAPIYRIADKVVDEAEKGNMTAITIIRDSTDGKPQQFIEHSGTINHETALNELENAALGAGTETTDQVEG
jgi:hypothetical protein